MSNPNPAYIERQGRVPTVEAIEAKAVQMREEAKAKAERQRIACGWDKALPVQPLHYYRCMAEANLKATADIKQYADKERRRIARGGKVRSYSVVGQGR